MKKPLFILTILFFLLLPSSLLKGQIQDTTINSAAQSGQRPLNPGLGKEVFSAKNMVIFGSTLGGAFLLDEWADDQLRKSHTKFLGHYTDVATVFGEKKIMAPATLAAWGVGMVTKDERLTQTALNSAKALVTGAILVEATKIIAGRSRPDMNRGSLHFDAFGGTENGTKSFPSGHAFVSWAVFTPFAEEYSKWIYIVPASVSFARMYRNRHWFSDVVLGSGIGYFAGLYFHKRKNQKVIYTGNGIIIKF